jgi:hypothetical protein
MTLFNRIGIALNFLSFWLVTPELIGEARLKNWEKQLEKQILAQTELCLYLMGVIFYTTGIFMVVLLPADHLIRDRISTHFFNRSCILCIVIADIHPVTHGRYECIL